MAQTAIGNEKNAYLQAKLIFEFVRGKMHYKVVRRERGSGVKTILDFPNTDPKTGEQYYEGACGQQSVFFVSLCRAIGIPARGVNGRIGWDPWMKKEDLKYFEKMLMEKRASMLEDIEHIEDNSMSSTPQDSSGDLSAYSYHMADLGTDNYEQEFTLGLIEGERAVLREIDEALERIEK